MMAMNPQLLVRSSGSDGVGEADVSFRIAVFGAASQAVGGCKRPVMTSSALATFVLVLTDVH